MTHCPLLLIKPTMQQMSSSSDILWPSGVGFKSRPNQLRSGLPQWISSLRQGTGVHVQVATGMGLRQVQTKDSDQVRDAT